jgi:hypothetical protein
MKCTPLRYMPMRHTLDMRYTPMRCMPVRYTPVVTENSYHIW